MIAPPTRHAEGLVDSDTPGARSTPSDSTAPLPPDHSLTHASPTLVPILCRAARMAMRVPPAMSPGLSASIAEVAAMSDLAFCKRFRSSYESSPSSSPPDLPSRKHYRGTSKLVEDDEEEEDDDEEEDEEVEESLDSDRDEGLAAGDEGPDIRVESLSLGGDEAVLEGQQRAASVVETAVGHSSGSVLEPERPERVSALRQPTLTTWIDLEDGIAYIDVLAYPPPAPHVQTPPSLEWSFGSLHVSPAPSIIPSPISSPMIPLTVPSPVASPATAEAEGFLTEYDRDIGELVTRSGAVRDETFSQRYRFKSQTDAQRVALWHAISDMQMENQELRLQIVEERHARLYLAEIVDSMSRGQDPRGDV
ncbi:hypothetical protein Tco_0831407 [Tanacetum coccineum]